MKSYLSLLVFVATFLVVMSMSDRSIDVDQQEQQEAFDEENRCPPGVWGC